MIIILNWSVVSLFSKSSAIQFVLAHEFHHLPPRQRENMLHSSSGLRATSAYVEIIFNNEDKRFSVIFNLLNMFR